MVLAAAGLVGFAGNELAAQVRLRAGKRFSSPALIAAGNRARVREIDLVRRGEIDRDSNVLYAHIGGQLALNAYAGASL